MNTVVLTKSDGLVCGLPAASIVAVLSAALDGGDPEVRSVAVSTFRGMTCPALAHTASEAADEIEKVDGARDWIALACGDDFTRISPSLLMGFDQIDSSRLVAFYERPDGQIGGVPVNNSAENLKLLKGENNDNAD